MGNRKQLKSKKNEFFIGKKILPPDLTTEKALFRALDIW